MIRGQIVLEYQVGQVLVLFTVDILSMTTIVDAGKGFSGTSNQKNEFNRKSVNQKVNVHRLNKYEQLRIGICDREKDCYKQRLPAVVSIKIYKLLLN